MVVHPLDQEVGAVVEALPCPVLVVGEVRPIEKVVLEVVVVVAVGVVHPQHLIDLVVVGEEVVGLRAQRVRIDLVVEVVEQGEAGP